MNMIKNKYPVVIVTTISIPAEEASMKHLETKLHFVSRDTKAKQLQQG